MEAGGRGREVERCIYRTGIDNPATIEGKEGIQYWMQLHPINLVVVQNLVS